MKEHKSDWDICAAAREGTRKKLEERKKKETEENLKNFDKYKTKPYEINKDLHKYHDSIYTMNNDEATILYIVVMLVAIIFKDRLLIWIVATLAYYWHITRHKRR